MPYQMGNAYDPAGSGMKMGQSYMPDWDAFTLQGRQNQNNLDLAKLNQQPAMARLGFDQQKWGQLYPMLSGAMGNLMGGGHFGVGGQSTPGPHINANPIWNPQMIDQRVNQMRAGNDATAAGQQNRMQTDLAARGFGAQSPLAQMLGSTYQAQAMRANTTGENDLRFNAAQGNAQQVLKAQSAQEAQHAARMNEDIERRKTYTGALSGMLGALGRFM